MKTRYGKECEYFYSDYFRGHTTEECRLIGRNPESEKWFPALCQTCPVPDLLMANQCPHLHLYGRVGRGFLGLTKKVEVDAFCEKYLTEVAEPRVGCGHCHEVQDTFTEAFKGQ